MRWNCGKIKSTTEGDRFFVFCGFEPKVVIAAPEFDKKQMLNVYRMEEDGFWVQSLSLHRNKNIYWYATDVDGPLPDGILDSIDGVLCPEHTKKLVKMPKKFGDFTLASFLISDNDYYVVCDNNQALIARDAGLSSRLLSIIDPTIVFDEIIDLRAADTQTIVNIIGDWIVINQDISDNNTILYDGRFYDFSNKDNVIFGTTSNYDIYKRIRNCGTIITHDYQCAVCAFALGKNVIWIKGDAEKTMFPEIILESGRVNIISYPEFIEKDNT